jgi:hypothetical protein
MRRSHDLRSRGDEAGERDEETHAYRDTPRYDDARWAEPAGRGLGSGPWHRDAGSLDQGGYQHPVEENHCAQAQQR